MELHKLSPILCTTDLQGTIAFYEKVLGFRGASHFPNFVTLSRENVEIMFIVPQDEPDDCKEPDNKVAYFTKSMLTGSLFNFIEQVDKLWELVKDKPVIKSSLADREYLMRDFSILDNNRYKLVFGQDISNYNTTTY